MKELRPWQIAVMAAALLVLGVSLYFQLSDESKVMKFADSVTVVDVTTGELFEAPLPSGRSVVYPAKNPGTGKDAVFPVQKDDSGWSIPSRYLPQVKDFFKEAKESGKVDLKEGTVSVASDNPKKADIF